MTQRTFQDVDDELYLHEQRLYRYAASGGGSNPEEDPEWVAKRARLTAEWEASFPYAVPTATKPKPLWDRICDWWLKLR